MSVDMCFYYGDCPYICDCSEDYPHAICANRTTDPKIVLAKKDSEISILKKLLNDKDYEIVMKDAIIENLESKLYRYSSK